MIPSKNNKNLAKSCRETKSSCCYKGLIFLPDEEYFKILEYTQLNLEEHAEEFMARCKKYDGFYLYDQKSKCQFLDEIGSGSCRLHDKGVKPSECFWWPLHVYVGDEDELEIKVSNCCSGCLLINKDDVQKIKKDAERIGYDLFAKLRQVHPCGETYAVVEKISLPSGAPVAGKLYI